MKRILLQILLLLILGCGSNNKMKEREEDMNRNNFNYAALEGLDGKYHINNVYSEVNDFEIEITPIELGDIDENTGNRLTNLENSELFEAGIIIQGNLTRYKVIEGTTLENVMSQKMSALEDYSDISHNLCVFKRDKIENIDAIRATCKDNSNILFLTVVGPNANKNRDIMNELISVMTS